MERLNKLLITLCLAAGLAAMAAVTFTDAYSVGAGLDAKSYLVLSQTNDRNDTAGCATNCISSANQENTVTKL